MKGIYETDEGERDRLTEDKRIREIDCQRDEGRRERGVDRIWKEEQMLQVDGAVGTIGGFENNHTTALIVLFKFD